jgi:diguanylate cyclase (GGDEF)-like protein
VLTFASFHFVVDLPTLCLVTVFISVTGGLLLLFSWLQNKSESALALWGIGYLIGSVGVALLALSGRIPDGLSGATADALLCVAYGVMWGGARSFEGRRIRLYWVLAGAAFWLAACQFDAFYASLPMRVILVSAIIATYVLLAAWEVWHGRDRELISRWPTLALLLMHAGFMLVRIPFAGAVATVPFEAQPNRLGILVMAFEALFAAFCLAFLRVSMAKERVELAYRKAALTDALTGAANRRAFFEFGERLLERTLADRRPAALLLFDLDRFKDINDTAGHPAGDRVLQIFSDHVTSALRPGDVFARLGGEEFACLVLDAPMAEALRVAERVRCEFAATPLPDLATNATVSIGVAMANETGRTLQTLLASADRALYRAKAEGRNRVAPAPLVLVETAAETARSSPDTARPAPIAAAPMAG